MAIDLLDVPILARREIEARIAAPLIQAFIKEFGREKTLRVVQEVIDSLAKDFGAQLASHFGGNSLEDWITKGMEIWEKDGTCQSIILERSETKLSFNVVQCQVAEMAKNIGISDLGVVLFCNRDFAMYKAFNPNIKFSRTKTIMEGADHCDFRCVLEGDE